MRRINFIKPIPPMREKELRVWYRITFSIGILLIAAITIISAIQLYLWIDLYRKRTSLETELINFTAIITQQKTDRTLHNRLKMYSERIERYVKDPKNPQLILNALIDAVKENQLLACTISGKSIDFQITASSPEQILAVMQRLSIAHTNNDPLIHDIKLTSLSSSGSHLSATIQAVPINRLHDRKYDRMPKS